MYRRRSESRGERHVHRRDALGGPIAGLVTGGATTRTAYTVAFVIIALFPLAATLGIARLHRDAGSAARAPAAPRDSSAVYEQSGS